MATRLSAVPASVSKYDIETWGFWNNKIQGFLYMLITFGVISSTINASKLSLLRTLLNWIKKSNHLPNFKPLPHNDQQTHYKNKFAQVVIASTLKNVVFTKQTYKFNNAYTMHKKMLNCIVYS